RLIGFIASRRRGLPPVAAPRFVPPALMTYSMVVASIRCRRDRAYSGQLARAPRPNPLQDRAARGARPCRVFIRPSSVREHGFIKSRQTEGIRVTRATGVLVPEAQPGAAGSA